MLDNEDIQKLSEVFATKDEIKEMIEPLSTKENFNDLMRSIDAYASKVDTYSQEMTMLVNKVDRHDKWITQIAAKLGIKLEY